MTKLVILRVENRNLETGFAVTLQIGEDGGHPSTVITGGLPPAAEVYQIYERWQLLYLNLGGFLRSLKKIAQQNISITDKAEFGNLAAQLEQSLNNWLNSQQFRPLKEELFVRLKPSEEIRVLIQTEDVRLRRLPWHLWDIFERYRKAEVALGTLEYKKVDRAAWAIPSDRVRILAVLGNSAGIDIQKDRKLLENLSADAEILFLVEPSRKELDMALWDDQAWDILFFAGHSYSQVDGKTGYLCINPTESLTINDLKNGLRASIERGLQIAIFNSCDGLGLAQSLAELHIPQVIIIRESVPDIVAHEFLKHFLKVFSSGKSLYISVREAREQLQGLENDFPCASSLPIICQNTGEFPPTWQELCPISFVAQQRAKNEYLTVSQKGVEAWNKWRKRNRDLVPNLKKTDLRGANLRGANLGGVDLSRVDLSGADISEANLSEANLTNANLTAVQALNTNFQGALLTGACIQDWNINNATNFDDVICSYIYLREFQQERCPSYGNFTSEEFLKLFQNFFETVELLFHNGVHYRAFSGAFKKVQVENEGTELTIQSIENKGDGIVRIRISLPTDANKAEIHSEFIHNYELAIKAVEEKYKAEVQAKEREIEIYRKQNSDMKEIIELLASRTVNANVIAVSEINIATSKDDNYFNLSHANFGGDFVCKNQGNIITNYGTKQKLAEAAAEIQQILEELSRTYPPSTTTDKMFIVKNALQNIERNPILKARLLAAAQAGGLNALKELVEHPVINIFLAALEGWCE